MQPTGPLISPYKVSRGVGACAIGGVLQRSRPLQYISMPLLIADPIKHLLDLQTPRRELPAWVNGINRPVVNLANAEKDLVDYVIRAECDT